MTPQDEFLVKAAKAAKDAEHIFPAYAAAEAALESRWGQSTLAVEANNLFGRKASKEGHYEPSQLLVLPTKEFLHGEWVTVSAVWLKFKDWDECFRDRMSLLERLKSLYGEALAAPDGPGFVALVSKHWSTDPDRAKKVLETYNAHRGVLEGGV